MARNRKYQSASVRFGPALKALLICVFIGGSGVGYVWQKSSLFKLGRDEEAKSTRLRELRIENRQLLANLQALRSHPSIARAAQQCPGLRMASSTQIVHVLEVPPALLPLEMAAQPAAAPRALARRP